MKSGRLTRAIQILRYAQSGHIATVSYLSRVLKCSRRTVFRDLRLLVESGIPVTFDAARGGYAIPKGRLFEHQGLTDREYFSILLASLISPLMRCQEFAGELNDAIAKMMGLTSSPTKIRLERLMKSLVLDGQCQLTYPQADFVFQAITDSICDRRQLRIKYKLCNPERICCTKLSPYAIIVGTATTRLVARSSFHRRTLTFDLSMISECEETEDPYEVPVRYLLLGPTGTHRQGLPESLSHLPEVECIEEKAPRYQVLA